ncbi:MAG: 2Fe-2S iron-sulfur cluster-binding protein [Planctomycetota bacterium]|nr:2Fe-2S iron-sulfur cluster-binding protein [Planctomycetota bacterium]MDA0934879.1 2Fe-2S iron-sulfur cluster-binding protein [Planctomycetota bacterium]MDA1222150.1 2Fe-2S iron-sulfur cluster-binding protein [Planctomycetota bacterium]
MTKVRIEVLVDDPSRDDVDTVMECAPGSDVVDACDAACAPIDFSCRAACCSTCRIQVLAGAEWLAPPGDLEDELIAASGEAPGVRYTCVARVAENAPDGATIRVRPLGAAF